MGPPAKSLPVMPQLAPVEAYVATFEMLAHRNKYAAGRAMLLAQYGMPNHVATMRHLALAVCGVAEHRVANLLYGGFAARVRREIDVPRPKYEIWVLATWPEPPIDALGEFACRLRPEVRRALEQLGWVKPPVLGRSRERRLRSS